MIAPRENIQSPHDLPRKFQPRWQSQRLISTPFCRKYVSSLRCILDAAHVANNCAGNRRNSIFLRRTLIPTSSQVAFQGGVSCGANQDSGVAAGQSDLGKKTSLSLCSAAALSSQRAGSSLATGSRRKSVSRAASAPNAMPTSSSPADRSRTRARFTRSMARFCQSECQAKATGGKAGTAVTVDGHVRRSTAGTGLRVGEPTRIGRLSWPALGRTSNVSEPGVTAVETALNSLGMVTSSAAAKRLSAVETNGRNSFRPQDATPASSPFQENFQFQSALEPARDADTAIAPGLSDPPVAVVVLFSSGDGLGIHQPGSMTLGGFGVGTTAQSGRARQRATCPAVARSSSLRRVA